MRESEDMLSSRPPRRDCALAISDKDLLFFCAVHLNKSLTEYSMSFQNVGFIYLVNPCEMRVCGEVVFLLADEIEVKIRDVLHP